MSDDDWPPAWLEPAVGVVLRKANAVALYTRTGRITIAGWFHDDPQPATRASDDESEAIGLLEERGYLAPSGRARLVDESGEEFEADRIEITPTGRGLFDRLYPDQGR